MQEFDVLQVQQMTAGLTDKQKLAFEIQYSQLRKDPTMVLILAICTGSLGVDRFILDDMGMGILKLLTAGCCGILWLIDIFSAKDRAYAYNRLKAEMVLASVKSTA